MSQCAVCPRCSAFAAVESGVIEQVTAGAFETAGLRGEDRMEDFHFIASPLLAAGPDTHLIGAFALHAHVQIQCK